MNSIQQTNKLAGSSVENTFERERPVGAPEYSVSEVSHAIKHVIESKFSCIKVRGEVSGFKRAASGHIYFSLKDDKAVISGICWRGTASKLSFNMQDGMEVIITGNVSTYAGNSSYQIIASKIEISGTGTLLALLEKLKKKLHNEGLFDASRKRFIPKFPSTIGVITSPTGAVIRDILHRVEDRYPCVRVLVWPVAVQGEDSPSQVVKAINGFNRICESDRPDVLIIARGGGSIEDLWSFNDEGVVRAVAASDIPTVSAIGHETDFTLIDFAADKRAPTPTAAAEFCVPVLEDVQNRLKHVEGQLINIMNRKIQEADYRLDKSKNALNTLFERIVHRLELRLSHMSSRISPRAIMNLLELNRSKLSALGGKLSSIPRSIIRMRSMKLDSAAKLLNSYSYQNTISRGFAVVRDMKANFLRTKKEAKESNEIQIEFLDGSVDAIITTSKRGVKPNKRSKKMSNTVVQSKILI